MRADAFEEILTRSEQKLTARLTSPPGIQEFLTKRAIPQKTSTAALFAFFESAGLTALTARSLRRRLCGESVSATDP
jgi:hypothetical protein